jgi:endonuclease YncB( thermonuclease family)
MEHQGASTAVYEVMLIPSGVELIVKYDAKPTMVRLLGIDRPTIASDPKFDVLNQRNCLHSLIQIGAKVILEFETVGRFDAQGHLAAQVRRVSDGLWLNLEMLDQGFATTSTTAEFAARAEFAAAEHRAKNGERGMWAPNYLEAGVQPTPFVPPHHVRRAHPVPIFLMPPGGWAGPPMNWQGGNSTILLFESTSSAHNERYDYHPAPCPQPPGSPVYGFVPPYFPPQNSGRESSVAPFWGTNPVSPYQNGGSFGTGSAGMPGAGHFGGFVHPGHNSGHGGGGPLTPNGSGSSGSSGSSSSGSAGHGSSGSSGHTGHHPGHR